MKDPLQRALESEACHPYLLLQLGLFQASLKLHERHLLKEAMWSCLCWIKHRHFLPWHLLNGSAAKHGDVSHGMNVLQAICLI